MSTLTSSSNSTPWVPPANGIVGGYTGDNVNILRAEMAFAAIAFYNAFEIIFLVFFRFKHYKGLYFWSLMVTAWAIIVYMIGAWGKMENIAAQTLITQTFDNIGWICMVGGNSLVLYSRLHLICSNRTALRFILWVILLNSFLMYIPTTALDYGCNVNPWNKGYCNGYSVMERIQMTLFSVQEFGISGYYLLEVYRYLKIMCRADLQTKRVLYELVAVNVALIILDVALLSVEYEDLYQIEVTLKGFVYSLKLKLELGVLSRLVQVVSGSGSNKLQKGITFSAFDDKNPDFITEHLEDKRSASISPTKRSSSSVPWLGSLNRQLSHPEPSGKDRNLSSMEFVTTADVDSAHPRMNSSRVYRMPTDAEIDEAFTMRDHLDPPVAALQKPPPTLSRQSSFGIQYPGRITGG